MRGRRYYPQWNFDHQEPNFVVFESLCQVDPLDSMSNTLILDGRCSIENRIHLIQSSSLSDAILFKLLKVNVRSKQTQNSLVPYLVPILVKASSQRAQDLWKWASINWQFCTLTFMFHEIRNFPILSHPTTALRQFTTYSSIRVVTFSKRTAKLNGSYEHDPSGSLISLMLKENSK